MCPPCPCAGLTLSRDTLESCGITICLSLVPKWESQSKGISAYPSRVPAPHHHRVGVTRTKRVEALRLLHFNGRRQDGVKVGEGLVLPLLDGRQTRVARELESFPAPVFEGTLFPRPHFAELGLVNVIHAALVAMLETVNRRN